jgi:hypothetical protein
MRARERERDGGGMDGCDPSACTRGACPLRPRPPGARRREAVPGESDAGRRWDGRARSDLWRARNGHARCDRARPRLLLDEGSRAPRAPRPTRRPRCPPSSTSPTATATRGSLWPCSRTPGSAPWRRATTPGCAASTCRWPPTCSSSPRSSMAWTTTTRPCAPSPPTNLRAALASSLGSAALAVVANWLVR